MRAARAVVALALVTSSAASATGHGPVSSGSTGQGPHGPSQKEAVRVLRRRRLPLVQREPWNPNSDFAGAMPLHIRPYLRGKPYLWRVSVLATPTAKRAGHGAQGTASVPSIMARVAEYPLNGFRYYLLASGLQPKTAAIYTEAIRRLMMRLSPYPSLAELEKYDHGLDAQRNLQNQFRSAWRRFRVYMKEAREEETPELKKKISWVKAANSIYPHEYYRSIARLLSMFADFTYLPTTLIADVRTNWIREDLDRENAGGFVMNVGRVNCELILPRQFAPIVVGIVNLCHPGHALTGLPRRDLFLFPRVPDRNERMFPSRIESLIRSVGGDPIVSTEDERFLAIYRPGGATPFRVSGPPQPAFVSLLGTEEEGDVFGDDPGEDPEKR